MIELLQIHTLVCTGRALIFIGDAAEITEPTSQSRTSPQDDFVSR